MLDHSPLDLVCLQPEREVNDLLTLERRQAQERGAYFARPSGWPGLVDYPHHACSKIELDI
jgi:hypothetical protein